MLIRLTEPVSLRYIYINPVNYQVHLLMPVVSGSVGSGETGIGLDNTCRSVSALKEFFGKSGNTLEVAVLNELTRYKQALELDISLISDDMAELKTQKEERLVQINTYLDFIKKIQTNPVLNTLGSQYPEYPEPLKALMGERDTNLYSMVLRPTVQDSYLRSVNPVFSVKRNNDSMGNPDSNLYQALHEVYKTMTIVPKDARTRLTEAVSALPEGQQIDFAGIQRILSQKVKELFNIEFDFSKDKAGAVITQAAIDEVMGFTESAEPVTAQDYVDALIGYCDFTLDDLPEPPFHTAKTAENLSILTQFFLGTVNIYCRANSLSTANFGQILDVSQELSEKVVRPMLDPAYLSNTNIEDRLLDFINTHSGDFGLTRALTLEDIAIIKQQFMERYAVIKGSPHFDEFIVFDSSKPGKFVNHHGYFCTDFCEVYAKLKNSFFLQQKCKDFATLPRVLPHHNKWIASSIEVDIDQLTDEELTALFEKLPKEGQQEMLQGSERLRHLQEMKALPDFLHHVARGQQDEAEKLLAKSPNPQHLLRTPGTFTDYSGRRFNCTAYEYAYWAKDTHMCRMLESHMDKETKAFMATRINEMKHIDAATGQPVGLVYQQNGAEHRSAHFDFTPLIQALQFYVDNYDAWRAAGNWSAMIAAWMNVGLAQRDVPAHVAQEYCRPDRAFYPCPHFNEPALPRILTFNNWITSQAESWFPLTSSGLGFDFALCRREEESVSPRSRNLAAEPDAARFDLAAVRRLDEVRTVELTQSREHLNPPPMSQSMSV